MTVRFNLTQPDDWHAAFTAEAKSKGLTLSAWMAECCLDQLTVAKRKKLTQTRTPRGTPATKK